MRETLHKQIGREAAAASRRKPMPAKALRAAARIITPGAWWDGTPPNAAQQRRVDLAMQKAREVFAVFAAVKS